MRLDQIFLFRIMHIDNIEYVLKLGKFTIYNSKEADPNYINIGESELINLRSEHEIITSHSNKKYYPSRDFLPFYLWYKSIMLYRIQTGYNIKKIKPENIIYAVYKLENIIDNIEYLFTNGHGYAKFTQWYDNIKYLNEIDWNIVKGSQWKNTEDDTDRLRRKQAEFWIKKQLSLKTIFGLAVYDKNSKNKLDALCKKYNRDIKIKIKPEYYYD